ncbi:MAG TPA: type II toxin-antitoxin system RelE/ParE family toxin [Acetobacteraceae bacterium]|jgi:hypothetical protein
MMDGPITVVETPQFIRQAQDVWKDDELAAFVDFIARNPDAGDVIPGAHGVRKLRWRRQGGGKRGGVRVIYFYHSMHVPVYLLMVYAKAMREDISPDARKALADFAMHLKRGVRTGRLGE